MSLVRDVTPYSLRPESVSADRLRWPEGLWTFRPAGTPDWLIMICSAGEGFCRIASGKTPVGAHELLLIPPAVPHDFGVETGGWTMIWAHFVAPPGWAGLLSWPELGEGVRRLSVSADSDWRAIWRGAEMMAEAWRDGGQWRERLTLNALERVVLLAERQIPAKDRRLPISAEVMRAMRLLERGQKSSPLPEIARQVGLSTSRLAHRFRDEVGASPAAWRERKLLERARNRLQVTAEPIKAIAADLGYACPFHFSKRFRRVFGLTPTQSRWGP